MSFQSSWAVDKNVKIFEKIKKSIFVTWFNVKTRDFKMGPFKISGKNNAIMRLRTNDLNGKGNWRMVFLNYFILIFIHQTISTYHNKVTKAWRYTSQFWYNRTLGIFNLRFMSSDLKHYLYPEWKSKLWPRAVLEHWTKTLISSRKIGKQYRLGFILSYMSLKSS